MHTVLKIQFYVIFLSFVTQFLTSCILNVSSCFTQRGEKKRKENLGLVRWDGTAVKNLQCCCRLSSNTG